MCVFGQSGAGASWLHRTITSFLQLYPSLLLPKLYWMFLVFTAFAIANQHQIKCIALKEFDYLNVLLLLKIWNLDYLITCQCAVCIQLEQFLPSIQKWKSQIFALATKWCRDTGLWISELIPHAQFICLPNSEYSALLVPEYGCWCQGTTLILPACFACGYSSGS